MESWRERGFVPDSDEEDGFDSLDVKKLNIGVDNDSQRLDYIALPASSSPSTPENNEHEGIDQRGEGENKEESPALLDAEVGDIPNRDHEECSATPTTPDRRQSAAPGTQSSAWETAREPSKSPGDKTPKRSCLDLKIDALGDAQHTDNIGSILSSSIHETEVPSIDPPAERAESEELSIPVKPTESHARETRKSSKEQADIIWDFPISSEDDGKGLSKSTTRRFPGSSKLRRARHPQRPPQTPPAKAQSDIWSNASSSPDELSLVLKPAPKPSSTTNQVEANTLQQIVSDDESSLSSISSSLNNPLYQDQSEAATEAPAVPHTDLNERLEDILYPLDIPEDVLRELSQPMRRSLRQRNPIQLHPYLLEQAHYQTLMKTRGVKPVRMAIPQQMRQEAGESQEQDSFDPEVPASSPPADEYLPRPRAERGERSTGEQNHHQHSIHQSPNRQAHVVKRRKISHSGAPHDQRRRLQTYAGRRVVIDNNTPRKDYSAVSIYDVPPSSPRSGSTSLTTRAPRFSEGFVFPPGSSPPMQAISSKEPISRGQDADQNNEMGSIGVGTLRDDDEAQSVSSQSQQSSDAESGPGEEDIAVRRLQRRIRGVLPASWLRLDQKMQGDKQKPSSRERHALSQRTENAKGVARKIVRRTDPSRPSSPPRHRALIDLGDSDEDKDGTHAQSVSDQDDIGRKLATIVGFEDPFGQDEDDIPEDNRIDYMFGPTPRPSGSRREKRKSLKRPKSKENGLLEERQRKKARLKRQTRLTDASYGGRRTKQSTRVQAPKLGILDAPDVAERSRKEQPQFLRVAARGVRSRRDGGRRSPTRKFFKLASNADTADANESLRGWRKGSMQQAKIDPPPARPRKRQPLTNNLSGPQSSSVSHPSARTLNRYITKERAPHQDRGGVVPEQAFRENHEEVPSTAADDNAITPKPAQPEQRGQQWVIRRNVAISSLKRNAPRPAATNVTDPQQSQSASKASFRSLSMLNKDSRRQPQSQANLTSLTLDRYLADTGHRRSKKQTPKRIVIESDDEQEAEQEAAITVSDEPEPPTIINTGNSRPSFHSAGRLFNWQRSYSVDFAIKPLRNGTFFHESTFIGSGELSQSLQLKRDMDHDAGLFAVDVENHQFQWSAWNDTVSSEMGQAFEFMTESVERSATTPSETGSGPTLRPATATYRSLIKYVSEKLTFIDPVDRTGFVTRALGLVSGLRDILTVFIVGNEHNKIALARIAAFNLVLAHQIHQIASHTLVDKTLADEAFHLVKNSAEDFVSLVSTEAGVAEIHRLLEELKEAQRRESGLREEFPLLDAYVVTINLLHSTEKYQGWFEDFQVEACTSGILRNDKDVQSLELGWRTLFAFLPLNEMDRFGIARKNSRFETVHDNWNLVKRLLSPVLDQYDTNSATQAISYNAYCRTLLHRCHHLLNTWGWRNCKPILDTLYDFFARRTLYNLKLEESRGSPSFLDELDRNPYLDIRIGEPCFHALLKIIASGLRFLSQSYAKKKILGIVWRLLPNHGRVYPKEQELRHEDLDALRNHHDLLCTLYWAVPDGCRPRLSFIRNLVHPASSHRETCSISLRSWTRLVRFKLSTDENVSGLDEFADWVGYFVNELLKQRSLARTEIESQSKGDNQISQHLVESTIAQNQRQIESLLNTALRGLQGAIEQASSLEYAWRLVSKMPFESLLGLFNPKLARVNNVVSGALQVIVSYTHKDGPTETPTAGPAVVATDEDSQEYGNWAEIEAALNSPGEGIDHVENVFHPAVARLVSNCFGADTCPEDAILLHVVGCWTSIAQILVRHGRRYWYNYLNPYEPDSWIELLPTVQTRKFTPQFLAECIEKDVQLLSDYRMQVLGMWMASLVERSSMLKFQHRLTQTVVNASPKDPLLANLPFLKDTKTGRYTITLEELSQRRLSLISSLLSNMREHVRSMELEGSREAANTKREYRELLLQPLMTAMKKNYGELGNGAAQSAKGTYVDFVHRVVEFLQQYTNDIGPIDPFFTDSSSFPLPSTDPLYIVAKLKAYGPKLASDKEVKTLTMFIQSISERAVVDGQQGFLVDQLHASMQNTYEAGDARRPTLQSILLQCVFPSYMETAFRNRASWLLTRPIIQTTSLVFKDLLLNLDTTDSACLSSVLSILDIVSRSSYHALHPLLESPAKFKIPTVLITLATFFDMISSSLVALHYIDRAIDAAAARAAAERVAKRKAAARGIILEGVANKNPITELAPAADAAVDHIRWFRDFAVAVTSHLDIAVTSKGTGTGHEDNYIAENQPVTTIQAPEPPPPPTSPSSTSPLHTPYAPPFTPDARRLASKELHSYLESWSVHRGKYYLVRRGSVRQQEVSVEAELAATIENEKEARAVFDDAAGAFVYRVQGMRLLKGLR